MEASSSAASGVFTPLQLPPQHPRKFSPKHLSRSKLGQARPPLWRSSPWQVPVEVHHRLLCLAGVYLEMIFPFFCSGLADVLESSSFVMKRVTTDPPAAKCFKYIRLWNICTIQVLYYCLLHLSDNCRPVSECF